MAKEESKKPVKEFRFGAIKVAVWKREHEGKVFYSTSLSRSYRLEPEDRDGSDDDGWRETASFDTTDLATVKLGLEMAITYITREIMASV
jgi:hypothetical protein